jgi:hypothetical protein
MPSFRRSIFPSRISPCRTQALGVNWAYFIRPPGSPLCGGDDRFISQERFQLSCTCLMLKDRKYKVARDGETRLTPAGTLLGRDMSCKAWKGLKCEVLRLVPNRENIVSLCLIRKTNMTTNMVVAVATVNGLPFPVWACAHRPTSPCHSLNSNPHKTATGWFVVTNKTLNRWHDYTKLKTSSGLCVCVCQTVCVITWRTAIKEGPGSVAADELLKQPFACNGTQCFVAELTKAHHWTLATSLCGPSRVLWISQCHKCKRFLLQR